MESYFITYHLECRETFFSLFYVCEVWSSIREKIFKAYKQKYLFVNVGRSLHTKVEKLNFYNETALQQSNSFTFTSNSLKISPKNPQTQRMAFKKYLINLARLEVHKKLKRLQMGQNISTKDRSSQTLIEPHTKVNRNWLENESRVGSRSLRVEIERKR